MLVICIPSLVSVQIFCPFFNWVVFLRLSLKSCLRILDTSPLSDKNFANIFSHSVVCPFFLSILLRSNLPQAPGGKLSGFVSLVLVSPPTSDSGTSAPLPTPVRTWGQESLARCPPLLGRTPSPPRPQQGWECLRRRARLDLMGMVEFGVKRLFQCRRLG